MAAAMASSSSLASQQFSRLRRSFSISTSSTSSTNESHIRFSTSCRAPRGVVAMAGSGKIKPKVGTICFGVTASQGALLLAGGEKGMRYAMPNARVMIHQPQSGCGGHVEDVRRQVNEAVQTRYKVDRMYAAFTGQPLEKVQQYTERDRFLSASEALEFGLIDGLLETEY